MDVTLAGGTRFCNLGIYKGFLWTTNASFWKHNSIFLATGLADFGVDGVVKAILFIMMMCFFLSFYNICLRSYPRRAANIFGWHYFFTYQLPYHFGISDLSRIIENTNKPKGRSPSLVFKNWLFLSVCWFHWSPKIFTTLNKMKIHNLKSGIVYLGYEELVAAKEVFD